MKEDSWSVALATGVEFEAEVVADRLKDAGIPAVVLNRREKSIGISFSDQHLIEVMVPPDRLEEAKVLLSQAPISEEDLEAAALRARLDGGEEQG